ncbi:MAG: phage terminase large subunit family protein, partial [Opitutae bacterium]
MGQGEQEEVNAIQDIWEYIHSIYAPPPELTVSEWAEQYRFLSKEYNAKGGKFRLSVAPYQQEPMDAMNDPEVQSV